MVALIKIWFELSDGVEFESPDVGITGSNLVECSDDIAFEHWMPTSEVRGHESMAMLQTCKQTRGANVPGE